MHPRKATHNTETHTMDNRSCHWGRKSSLWRLNIPWEQFQYLTDNRITLGYIGNISRRFLYLLQIVWKRFTTSRLCLRGLLPQQTIIQLMLRQAFHTAFTTHQQFWLSKLQWMKINLMKSKRFIFSSVVSTKSNDMFFLSKLQIKSFVF